MWLALPFKKWNAEENIYEMFTMYMKMCCSFLVILTNDENWMLWFALKYRKQCKRKSQSFHFRYLSNSVQVLSTELRVIFERKYSSLMVLSLIHGTFCIFQVLICYLKSYFMFYIIYLFESPRRQKLHEVLNNWKKNWYVEPLFD